MKAASQLFDKSPGTGPDSLSKVTNLSGGMASIGPSGEYSTKPIEDRLLAEIPLEMASKSQSVSDRAPNRTPPIDPTPRTAILIHWPPCSGQRSGE